MRRVATHRVYNLQTKEWQSMRVIEMDEEGRLLASYPFAGEIAATEWWSGMALLSPVPVARTAHEDIHTFLARASREVEELPLATSYFVTFYKECPEIPT